MKKRGLEFYSTFLLLILLSSCASVFMSKNQTLSFHTGTDSSQVFCKGDSSGYGSDINIKVRKNGNLQVLVEAPQHAPLPLVLLPSYRPTSFWLLQILNLPTLYFSMATDLSTSNTLNYPSSYTINLEERRLKYREPEKEKQLAPMKVYFSNPEMMGGVEIITATYPKRHEELNDIILDCEETYNKLKTTGKDIKKVDLIQTRYGQIMKSGNGFIDDLTNNIWNSEYGVNPDTIFADINNILKISLRIDNVWFLELHGKQHNKSIKAHIEGTWFVHNNYEELIDSFNISSWSGEIMRSHYILIRGHSHYAAISDAITINYLKLQKEEAFNEILKKEPVKIKEFSPLKLNSTKKMISEKKDALKACVTVILPEEGHGSGFAVSSDGYLITNYHVIAASAKNNYEGIEVANYLGKKFIAKVVRFDKQHDIALLKVDSSFEYAFQVRDSVQAESFESIYTIGTPSFLELAQTVSTGMIVAYFEKNDIRLMQMNMAVNPGNSGGPVFDESFNLQGIVVSKLMGKAINISFAIPGNRITQYLNIIND